MATGLFARHAINARAETVSRYNDLIENVTTEIAAVSIISKIEAVKRAVQNDSNMSPTDIAQGAADCDSVLERANIRLSGIRSGKITPEKIQPERKNVRANQIL